MDLRFVWAKLDPNYLDSLIEKNWVHIFLYRGIAFHATTVKDSDIYIYGGLTGLESNKKFYLV